MPAKIISDDGKTFKSTSKYIGKVLENLETRKHFADVHYEWDFNLEKAPGGGEYLSGLSNQ